MTNQLLAEIEYRVKNIDTEDRVDDTIVNEIIKLKNDLLKVEKEWLKIDHKNNYSFYYGVRSVILVLEKIIERFQTESMDNVLQIAQDTLLVIPFINDIIQDAMQYKTDDDLAEHILEKTDQLDEKAYDANLLKSSEEYLHDIDKNTILKFFDGMLEIMEVPKKIP